MAPAHSLKVATDEGATVTTTVTAAAATAAAPAEPPSSAPRYAKRRIAVRGGGASMAYVDAGDPAGDPIVFLHGNPTSSYMWRNVMPLCEGLGCRLIAPDLIGMGDSDKLDAAGAAAGAGPDRYALAEQYAYLEALLCDALGLNANVTLVCHSWGATLGAQWASRHADAVKAFALMECAFTPFASDATPAPLLGFIRAVRSEQGEAMILQANVMIEHAIPGGVARALSDVELEHYRAPFKEPGEGRRAMLAFARAIPVDGEPADTVAMLDAGRAWLERTATPKLLVVGDPGSSTTPEERDRMRAWPNVTEQTVPGKHLLTEDSPDEIGAAIVAWYKALPE